VNGEQYPIQMWLRGLSVGIYIAMAGFFPSCFPYTTSGLIICWVIAGIYGKWRREEDEKTAAEEIRKIREVK
jgi:hypothetical protein